MKKNIHPVIVKDAVVICACGAKHLIESSIKEQHTEVCSKCHPFYTGKVKVLDTAGRIDKFKSRQKASA